MEITGIAVKPTKPEKRIRQMECPECNLIVPIGEVLDLDDMDWDTPDIRLVFYEDHVWIGCEAEREYEGHYLDEREAVAMAKFILKKFKSD